MSFQTILKKSVFALILSLSLNFVLCIVPLATVQNEAQAAWYDDWDDFADLFDTQEKGLTFTQFEGGVATLDPAGYDQALTQSSDLKEYILKIVNFALGFLGLLAVLIVIYGGVTYVTAAGEEEKTKTGKNAIMYASIGLLIVLGSFAFVNTIIKGAVGEGEIAGSEVTGSLTSASFNASAEQVRTAAIQIFEGYVFVAESAQEISGIVADAQKRTILPGEDVRQIDAINFLRSIESKMIRIKARVEPFSQTMIQINELINEIGVDIDGIENMDDDEFSDNWNEIHAKYNSVYENANDDYPTFGNIFQSIKNDYTDLVIKLVAVVIKSYQEVSGVEAIGGANSQARGAFDKMSELYLNVTGNLAGLSLEGTNMGEVNMEEIAAIGNDIKSALEYQAVLYETLKNIQFVTARLTADVTSGSSPLSVMFTIANSNDPAGGSIAGENVIWDVTGDLTLKELQSYSAEDASQILNADTYGQVINPNNASEINCEVVPQQEIGKTSLRCTYHLPGVYQVAVKIRSNEPEKYAPGISVVTIRVKPPTTKIDLDISSGNHTEEVMQYGGTNADILMTNKRLITFTLQEARAGLTFDASGTDAEKYKWNFGNGDIREFSTSGKIDDYEEYTTSGKYEVTLEVVSKTGVTDRKIFTLQIGELAARFNASPPNRAYVDRPITFDASPSRSDIGAIKNYEWKISVANPELLPAAFRDQIVEDAAFNSSGGNVKTITHKFKYPIKYNIKLTVTNESGETSNYELTDYQVVSEPPVALFDSDVPDESQPGTVHLDASRTYDNDSKYRKYSWTISPGAENSDWKFVGPKNEVRTIVKFNKTGDYKVTLHVEDELNDEEFNEITKTIKIQSVLDVDWAADQEVTAVADAEGKAQVDFKILSENGIAYEIDFGDGDIGTGRIVNGKIEPYPLRHTYHEGGKFDVKVTVFDDEDNDNTIERRVFIGGSTGPIAKIDLYVNDVLITDLRNPISLTKADILKFDGSKSKNTDGTARKLGFSWDFGDTNKSASKVATHSYEELSPKDKGFFTVTLKVFDTDDPSLVAETSVDQIFINVVNELPRFSSLQAIPASNKDELVTPVKINLKVNNATDKDSEILQYKWWYFDIDDPDEPLGIQITQAPAAVITIGTNGQEGREITYGFGVEIKDSDNGVVTSEDMLDDDQIPEVTVINGPNDLPVAKFNVNITSSFTGEEIVFTSSSDDPDGEIISYIWDLEGDGFFNNEPTDNSSVTYTYTEKNTNGYDVRLKVIDDKGGEAVSQPIKIYIDSLAEKPVAAFKFQVIEGSNGKKIKFINNSTADEKAGARIIGYKWDFDTDSNLVTADSDGDGVKDNDTDSTAKDPERLFVTYGNYNVKLTVTDNQGNTDEIKTVIRVPLANPPVAAFVYGIMEDGRVEFTNNSVADPNSEAEIKNNLWDFNIEVDTNGDGDPANDVDSTNENPMYAFEVAGIYKVKLTVVDDQGNVDDVINSVDSSGGPRASELSPTGALKAILLAWAVDGDGNIIGDESEMDTESFDPVNLDGDSGTVKFDFRRSQGQISHYILDKNIYFDTNGNGIKNDDEDFKTSLPGTWTTNFEKTWGKITVKLTVVDIYGNQNTSLKEIIFQ